VGENVIVIIINLSIKNHNNHNNTNDKSLKTEPENNNITKMWIKIALYSFFVIIFSSCDKKEFLMNINLLVVRGTKTV
jgi:hypothetical protein